MKKILTFFAALLTVAGLRAQTTPVKKETRPPSSVVKPSTISEQKSTKVPPGQKITTTTSKPQNVKIIKIDKPEKIAKSDKWIKIDRKPAKNVSDKVTKQ